MTGTAEEFRLERRCWACKGEGFLSDPRCALCNQPVAADDPWWETEDPQLPCGHEARPNLIEEIRCPTCDGAGRIMQIVSPEEYRAAMRRRLVRSVVLVLLGLIPLLVLIIAVSSRASDLLCGTWWYGIILLALALWL